MNRFLRWLCRREIERVEQDERLLRELAIKLGVQRGYLAGYGDGAVAAFEAVAEEVRNRGDVSLEDVAKVKARSVH